MDEEEDTMPEMKMDVMGLNHSAIMNRVRYLLSICYFLYVYNKCI